MCDFFTFIFLFLFFLWVEIHALDKVHSFPIQKLQIDSDEIFLYKQPQCQESITEILVEV